MHLTSLSPKLRLMNSRVSNHLESNELHEKRLKTLRTVLKKIKRLLITKKVNPSSSHLADSSFNNSTTDGSIKLACQFNDSNSSSGIVEAAEHQYEATFLKGTFLEPMINSSKRVGVSVSQDKWSPICYLSTSETIKDVVFRSITKSSRSSVDFSSSADEFKGVVCDNIKQTGHLFDDVGSPFDLKTLEVSTSTLNTSNKPSLQSTVFTPKSDVLTLVSDIESPSDIGSLSDIESHIDFCLAPVKDSLKVMLNSSISGCSSKSKELKKSNTTKKFISNSDSSSSVAHSRKLSAAKAAIDIESVSSNSALLKDTTIGKDMMTPTATIGRSWKKATEKKDKRVSSATLKSESSDSLDKILEDRRLEEERIFETIVRIKKQNSITNEMISTLQDYFKWEAICSAQEKEAQLITPPVIRKHEKKTLLTLMYLLHEQIKDAHLYRRLGEVKSIEQYLVLLPSDLPELHREVFYRLEDFTKELLDRWYECHIPSDKKDYTLELLDYSYCCLEWFYGVIETLERTGNLDRDFVRGDSYINKRDYYTAKTKIKASGPNKIIRFPDAYTYKTK